jgi:hypothetical protein
MAAIHEGSRFGTLTAKWQVRPHGYWLWLCLCDCGRTVKATHRELEDGQVIRCRECASGKTSADKPAASQTKTRPTKIYLYDPSLVVRCEGRASLTKGDLVRVLNIVRTGGGYAGAENFRGSTDRCYVETLDGEIVTLCACDSLVSLRSERAKQIVSELKSELDRMS